MNSDSDRVDDLMDEMQDEKDVHDQISDAISRGHGTDLNDVSITTYKFVHEKTLLLLVTSKHEM